MATGFRQIQRDLFDALRGRNGEEPASSPRASPASSRQDQLFESRASGSGARRGSGPGGPSIFQDVRARAREVVQGFREGRAGAGDRLRSLREEPGRDGDGTGTPRRKRTR